MKYVTGLIYLGSIYAIVLWIEYQTAVLLGPGCFLLAFGSTLAFLAMALRRAPEGHERLDGFHVYRRRCRANALRYIRFSQPARARQ